MVKPYLDYQDIMKLFNCKKTKAYEYIRAIKAVSDVGKTAGRIMWRDYNMFVYGTCEPGIVNLQGGEKVEAETSNSKVG